MSLLDPDAARRFHHGFDAYAATPLRHAPVAGRQTWIKDETGRMGLGAFKAIGGIYAVARLLGDTLGVDGYDPQAVTDAAATSVQSCTFVCASAGNHGMAVAEGSRRFGARCRIHLSQTVPEAFADRLRAKGAEVVRSGAVYDDSIAAAIADAARTGAIHLADGSWPGYTEPPRLVMEGYTIMADEMRAVFAQSGQWPDAVYLQAGVGGMAAAVAYMIRLNWDVQPRIIVVEPDAAPCLRDSAAAGEMVQVAGPVSAMGRLDCKMPSMLAFDILKDAADAYVTVSEAQARAATEQAAAMGYDSTPSGTAGLAALIAEATPPGRPLVIISEGAEAA